MNAAACAVTNNDNEEAITLLKPAYSTGSLYGISLWNIGLAQAHPKIPLLQTAIGSSLLFLDRNAEALDALYRASSDAWRTLRQRR